MLHDIEYSDLNEDVIDSLDNAALWAYKVGKDALSQAGLMDSRDTLKETGMIVGVSSAGTEAFLPLFEQRMEDFSLRKALFFRRVLILLFQRFDAAGLTGWG